MRFGWIFCALVGIAACKSKSSDEDSSGTTATDDQATTTPAPDEDSGTTADPTQFPAQPAPFTLTLSGAASETLSFDTPTCSHRTGSTTFRQFWRGPGHVYVLVVEMFDTFPGEAGAYTAADGVRTKLQEEAGGSLAYYDSEAGGTGASLTLDGFDTDANQVWGAATIGTLGDGSGGLVTVTPDEIPVWCDSME